MTSKEIAMNTIRDIVHSCDVALGYGAWQKRAEENVNEAFQVARHNRKSVTAVADELAKCSFTMSKRFGNCMCMAVGSVLADWLRFGWLRGYEVQRAYKMLED